MFRIAEIELGMENTIGITLETGVGVQSAILHICRESFSFVLCLLANLDIQELKISSLLLCHNRTGVGTLIYFTRKLGVK